MKKFLCALLGHKWNRDWRTIDPETWFARVDCVRCGLAIDGASLKRISEKYPDLTRGL